jgi:hypothetical protein
MLRPGICRSSKEESMPPPWECSLGFVRFSKLSGPSYSKDYDRAHRGNLTIYFLPQ